MPIIGKILLFEVSTTDKGNETKLYKVAISKGKASFVQKEYTGTNSLEKWKYSLAFLFITGNQVVTKPYTHDDLSIKRILENKDLYCDITTTNEESQQTISFVRREIPDELLGQLKKNQIPLITLFIGKKDNYSIKERIELFWKKEMGFRIVRKSPEKFNMLCNSLYHRLQLPVLIMFFLLLLGNYFVNSHFRQENATMNTSINIKQKSDNIRQKEDEKFSRLLKLYRQAPDYSLASVADRIASYIPQNLTLNMLSIYPSTSHSNHLLKSKKDMELVNKVIKIKGWSDIPGSITLFTQFLSKDNMFDKVEVISLSRRKDENLFDFELQLTVSKQEI